MAARAPDGAAGLGDFQAESVYATSRFQGEGAAAEIRAALLTALDSFKASTGSTPDAIVIIRGGGAVNDLAWLNDYELVRCICELEVPVLTGIGHERDSTVLDEVANTRFDTPSKVISGIEQVIAMRVAEAKAYFEQIARAAGKNTQTVRRAVEQADATVKSGASRHLANARQVSSELMAQLRIGSVRAVKDAAELAQALAVEVRFEASQAVRTASAESRQLLGAVTERAGADVRTARDDVDRSFADVGVYSRQAVSTASTQSQALMREIAGQGPEKTLARGFAIVRAVDGVTVTSARDVPVGALLDIQFRDGQLAVSTADEKGRKRT